MKRVKDLRGQAMALPRGLDRAAAAGRTRVESRPIGGWLRSCFRCGNQGQSLVEFALVLPLLLMVMTGLLAFAIVFYQEMQLQQAVYAGARTLALNQGVSIADPCLLAATAVEDAAPAFNPSQLKITYMENGVIVSGSTCSGNLASSTSVTVTATYPCSYPIFGTKLGSCQLNATSTQPAE